MYCTFLDRTGKVRSGQAGEVKRVQIRSGKISLGYIRVYVVRLGFGLH